MFKNHIGDGAVMQGHRPCHLPECPAPARHRGKGTVPSNGVQARPSAPWEPWAVTPNPAGSLMSLTRDVHLVKQPELGDGVIVWEKLWVGSDLQSHPPRPVCLPATPTPPPHPAPPAPPHTGRHQPPPSGATNQGHRCDNSHSRRPPIPQCRGPPNVRPPPSQNPFCR